MWLKKEWGSSSAILFGSLGGLLTLPMNSSYLPTWAFWLDSIFFSKQKGILTSKRLRSISSIKKNKVGWKVRAWARGAWAFVNGPVKVEAVVWKLIRPLPLSHPYSELFELFRNLDFMFLIRKSDHKKKVNGLSVAACLRLDLLYGTWLLGDEDRAIPQERLFFFCFWSQLGEGYWEEVI